MERRRLACPPPVQPARPRADCQSQSLQSFNALESIKLVLAEADKAMNEKARTINTSDIPEALGGVVGGAIGAGASLTLLNMAGVAGFSAAGITSGLAALGAVAGGSMVAGIIVTAALVTLLSLAGYAILSERNKRRLALTKEAMFLEAVRKQDAIR